MHYAVDRPDTLATNRMSVAVNHALAAVEPAVNLPASNRSSTSSPALSRLQATYLSRQGAFEASLSEWREVPDAVQYLRGWGEIAWNAANYEEAVQWYALLSRIDPTQAYHHYRHGLALANVLLFDEADAALNEAAQALPSDEVGQSDVLFYQARIESQRAVPSLTQMLRLLDAASSANDFKENAFIPGQVQFLRGDTLAALGQDEEALDAYQQAVALNPAHYEAHIRWGNLLLGRDAGAATTIFCDAIAIDDQRAPAYLGLGRALAAQDDVASAAQAYKTVLTLDVTNKAAQEWLDKLPDVPAAQARDLFALCGVER
jgi:tetratricopeptide (TPR) repeat protein